MNPFLQGHGLIQFLFCTGGVQFLSICGDTWNSLWLSYFHTFSSVCRVQVRTKRCYSVRALISKVCRVWMSSYSKECHNVILRNTILKLSYHLGPMQISQRWHANSWSRQQLISVAHLIELSAPEAQNKNQQQQQRKAVWQCQRRFGVTTSASR